MKKIAMTLALCATIGAAQAHELGFAGLLSKSNRVDLEPLTLASGKPVAEKPYELTSGTYYRITIIADGSAELGLSGGDFFHAIWVNEVVINSIEVRPTGLHSLEFDDEGEALLSFIAIVPGRYELSIPGSKGESQKAIFIIK